MIRKTMREWLEQGRRVAQGEEPVGENDQFQYVYTVMQLEPLPPIEPVNIQPSSGTVAEDVLDRAFGDYMDDDRSDEGQW